MPVTPSASLQPHAAPQLENEPGMLGEVTSAIGRAGGSIGAIDIVEASGTMARARHRRGRPHQDHWDDIIDAVNDASRASSCWRSTTARSSMHEGGKITQLNKHPLKTRDDLSMAYTPGVARVCLAIDEDPELAFRYTIKRNYVAVVTDGSAVLGLGDIGPRAAMPVMEGKAMLLKEFGGRRRLPDLPRHEGPDEIVADGEGDRPGLRRHQPRGHLLPALLRDRGPPEGGARHPRLPRRPARHRRGRDGGAVQRAEDHRQAPRGPARRRWSGSARPGSR